MESPRFFSRALFAREYGGGGTLYHYGVNSENEEKAAFDAWEDVGGSNAGTYDELKGMREFLEKEGVKLVKMSNSDLQTRAKLRLNEVKV